MDSPSEPQNGLDAFRLYWAGKGKLSTAYWGFGVVGSSVVFLLMALGGFFFVPTALREHDSVFASPLFNAYLLATNLLLLTYQIVVWILIWRNAPNSSNAAWGNLAKAVVALGVVYLVYNFVEIAIEI
jgi:hypothetical protein